VIIRDGTNRDDQNQKGSEYVAVRVSANAENAKFARIPHIAMGNDEGWFFTLGDFRFSNLIDECPGKTTEGDARYLYSWTPDCYFGRPGWYQSFSFMTNDLGSYCEDSVDILAPITMGDKRCRWSEIIPQEVIVSFGGGSVESDRSMQRLGFNVSQHILWHENPF